MREKSYIDCWRIVGTLQFADREQLVLGRHAPVRVTTIAGLVDRNDIVPGITAATGTFPGIFRASIIKFAVSFIGIPPGVGVAKVVQAATIGLGGPDKAGFTVLDTDFFRIRDPGVFALCGCRFSSVVLAAGREKQQEGHRNERCFRSIFHEMRSLTDFERATSIEFPWGKYVFSEV